MFKRKYILVTGLLLAMAASSSSWAAQYARPNSTVTAAGWTPVAAGTLHEALDEVSGNDTDYITSGNGNNSSVILGLSPIVDPGTYTSNHILRYRCQSSNGAKGPERCNVALYQGTTQIYVAPNASASVGAFSLQSFTIPDASAITDYSALRVHLISDALDAGESIEISWVELEVPDAVATTPPTVTSPTFADVTDTTATLGGNVTDNGGATVTSRGVEWGTTPGGPWPNSTSAAAGGTGIFTVPVTGLPASSAIYFRAWATNIQGTSYSTESSFTTTATAVAPTVTTPTFTGVTDTTATLGGTVTADGGAAVTDRGIVWNTTSPAESGGTPVSMGSGTGTFAQLVSSLPQGTLIYFKAYATNSVGTSYSGESSFTTLTVAPTVTTPTFTGVGETTATLGGTVTSDGGAAVTDRGIVWNTTSPAESGGTPVSMGSGTGTFAQLVDSLPSDTLIYFKAYATNTQGTSYSTESSFTTGAAAVPPTVTTPTFTGVTDTTATLGGTVTADGGATVTDRGIVWNTTSPAETGGTTVAMGSGTGTFSQLVSSLPPDTLVYFKAYATNSAGTAYSAESSFTTDPVAAVPTVTTPTFTGVTDTTATLGGTVTADGGATVTERGVVWNTTSPAESGGTTVAMGSGTGTFAQLVSGLPQGTLVYFKAYAINSAGTAYSSESSFTTQVVPPTVDSPTFTDVAVDSATLGGTVSSDGGAAVTARGIVWNTTSPPETGGTVVPMGSGTGTFANTVTGLPLETLVYFRAYATNSAGTAYSSIASFTTSSGSEPTVQVSNLAFPTIAGSSIRMTWTRGNGDGVIVVMRLAATGKVDPQDGADYTGDPDYSTPPPELPTSSQNFVVYKGPATSVLVTGLTQVTGYAVAVYEYRGTGPSTDYLLTSPQEGTPTTTNYAVHNYDFRVNCSDCHKHGTFGALGADLKAICSTCHNPSGLASAKLEFGFEDTWDTTGATTTGHPTPTKNVDIDVVDCGMCHELHRHTPTSTNTTYSTHSVTSAEQNNKSFLRANVDKYVPNAATPAYLHTDTPGVDTPDRAVEDGNDTTARGYCQVCHTRTDYHRSSNTAASDQCHGGDPSCAGTEIHCGTCHQHNNNFQGAGDCTNCHDTVREGRPVITAQFNRNSSHIKAGTAAVTAEDCEVCHDQTGHPGDQIVGLLDADDGVTLYEQPTAGASTLATGEGEAFEQACLRCHDSNGASRLPAYAGTTDGQTDMSPFTGVAYTPTPLARFPEIDATNWGSASHRRPLATFSGNTPMTCIGDGTNGCHGSGHGSEQDKLLAPADVSPAGSMTDFCYVCHGTGGPTTVDIEAEFTGLEALNIGPVTSGGGATTIDNYHDTSIVFCNECHSPHVNNDLNPVADPDTDLPLSTYNPTGSYNEDGHSLSYSSGDNYDPLNPEGAPGTRSQPDYIQFCLTCHDGTTPPGVTMAANMINIASAYNVTDQHGSGDGSTGNKTSKGGLKAPWVNSTNDAADNDPNKNYSAMNCTTCHGAHGTGNIFNLRESITVADTPMEVGGLNGFLTMPAGTTSYTLPLIGGSQADHYWGAWCTFCHKGDSHPGKVETDSCTGGHMHGGGAF